MGIYLFYYTEIQNFPLCIIFIESQYIQFWLINRLSELGFIIFRVYLRFEFELA